MPELPEVEVTRMGIVPHIVGRPIRSVTVRNGSLRWPVPEHLPATLEGALVKTVQRRGKFILIECEGSRAQGFLLVHLGMTGTLSVLDRSAILRTHDHVDFTFDGHVLRYHDPRRFGSILWHDATDGPLASNRHLVGLGVEPLGESFAGSAGGFILFQRSRRRNTPIKPLLLAGEIVVGVGNIYASECLFRAGIHPTRAAGRISRARYDALAEAIRVVLAAAIARGGSTLRDFVGSDGAPGYFQQDYFVYDREGSPCRVCGAPIRAIRQSQRSTFYCANCQR